MYRLNYVDIDMIYSIISFLPRLWITLKPSSVSISSFNMDMNDKISALR